MGDPLEDLHTSLDVMAEALYRLEAEKEKRDERVADDVALIVSKHLYYNCTPRDIQIARQRLAEVLITNGFAGYVQ